MSEQEPTGDIPQTPARNDPAPLLEPSIQAPAQIATTPFHARIDPAHVAAWVGLLFSLGALALSGATFYREFVYEKRQVRFSVLNLRNVNSTDLEVTVGLMNSGNRDVGIVDARLMFPMPDREAKVWGQISRPDGFSPMVVKPGEIKFFALVALPNTDALQHRTALIKSPIGFNDLPLWLFLNTVDDQGDKAYVDFDIGNVTFAPNDFDNGRLTFKFGNFAHRTIDVPQSAGAERGIVEAFWRTRAGEVVLPVTGGISISPDIIRAGEQSTLNWNTTNATTIRMEPGIGVVGSSGTMKVAPESTTTYTLLISNMTGSFGKVTATVRVADSGDTAPPNVGVTISPGSIRRGESALLSWSSTDAVAVSIDNGIGSVTRSGSLRVSPTETSTYTVVATNLNGQMATVSIALVVAKQDPDR